MSTNIFVVKAMVSCIAILADQGLRLRFFKSINDWKGPSSDVLTALDKTIDEGWADKDNLLITGGSYAGYLTAWIISHDNRFKAACAQRGVYDLNTFLEKEMHGD
jgi:dipeptidyl aminopeptidase/acylaminoacyl peptidase